MGHVRKFNHTETVYLGRIRVPIVPSLLSPLISNGIRKGWYERDERTAIEKAVRTGDRVLDLGGGLGVCSATAAATADIHQLTIVEANPHMLDVIRLTMALNGIGNFDLVWGAVSTLSGETTQLQVGEHYWAARETASDETGTLKVPILSPSSLLSRLMPDVLICDIEGNERELIEAADLSSIRSLIIEFHPHIYGAAVMEKLDAKLRHTGLNRISKWKTSDKPQVHHYVRRRSVDEEAP